MPKEKIDPELISFRPAKLEDAKLAGRLLFETFPKKATYIIGLGSEERAKKILTKIFPLKGHRLSYDVTQIILYEGRAVGLMTSFAGRMLGQLDRRLDWYLLKQYRFRGKLALFIRGYPLFFIQEATHKEYFLSNLAVKKGYRGKGIGAKALVNVEDQAKDAGYDRVSLIVNIENKDARRFYDRNGFSMRAMHLESNQRVKYLGAGYQRMVKVLPD